jgi:hypothetical protein
MIEVGMYCHFEGLKVAQPLGSKAQLELDYVLPLARLQRQRVKHDVNERKHLQEA